MQSIYVGDIKEGDFLYKYEIKKENNKYIIEKKSELINLKVTNERSSDIIKSIRRIYTENFDISTDRLETICHNNKSDRYYYYSLKDYTKEELLLAISEYFNTRIEECERRINVYTFTKDLILNAKINF